MLHSLGTFLDRILRPVCGVFANLGVAAVALMMFLVGVDVVLRYIFSRPLSFSCELTQILLLITIFLGIAYTGLRKNHVSIDVVVSRLPEGAQAVLAPIVHFLGMSLLALIAWQAIEQTRIFTRFSQTTSGLHVPFSLLMIIVTLGSLVLSLVLLKDLIMALDRVLNRDSHASRIWLALGGLLAIGLFITPILVHHLELHLTRDTAIIFSLILLIVLIFLKLPVSFSMALVGFLGVASIVATDTGLGLLRTVPYRTGMFYDMSVIPLFILMGELCARSGLVADLYDAAYKWIGFLPGGLGVATIGASTGFAAVAGSSVASAGAMSRICYPEMKRYGYDGGLAMGCIAVGGTLGTVIPPSMDFIIYGILTRTSIGKLFIAGILPGLLIAVGYVLITVILCSRNPALGQRGPRTTFSDKLKALERIWGVVALFALVIGGIYMGVFTPIEGGGMGALGAFVFALARRRLTLKGFIESLRATVEMSAMILFILTGAFILSYFLTITKLPMSLAALLSSLPVPPLAVIGAILFMYLILGCIMDVFSAVVVTIPVLFPVVVALGYDPIWYGVLMIIVCEMGLETPPVGLNLFVVSGMDRDVPMSAIYRGVTPFILIELVVLTLIVMFPQIALFLPSLMK